MCAEPELGGTVVEANGTGRSVYRRGKFNEGSWGEAVNRQRIDPASGGSEWWYWHITTDKFSVTLAAHTTNLLGGTTESPYLSVTLACSEDDIRHKRLLFDADELRWTDRGHLILGDRIIESDRGWKIALRADDWELVGSISRASDGWRIEDSLLATDGVGSEMHWSVPMPRGRWNGKLSRLSGPSLSAQGFAYQDHNWADAPLSDLVHGWSWSTLSNAESTVIWANVESPFCAPDILSVRIHQRGSLCRRLWALRGKQIPNVPGNSTIIKRREYVSNLSKACYERRLIQGIARAKPAWGFSEHLVISSGPVGNDDPAKTRRKRIVQEARADLSEERRPSAGCAPPGPAAVAAAAAHTVVMG